MERSDIGPEPESPAIDTAKVFDSVGEELVRGRLAAAMFGRRVQPRRFGRFELRAPVGQGGMGTVYVAWDPVLEREVALKVVDTEGFGPGMLERALREARSLAKLSHPNVVSVFEAGQLDNRVWIAMELLAGQTLGKWVHRDPAPGWEEVLRMWIAVGRGLEAVHEAGLVHRDVKPGNVVVGEDGRPRLIDFGLVRDPGGAPLEVSMSDPADLDSQPAAGSVTEGFVGTLAYAAPEQHAGAPLDARADQYALCVSIWEALYAERPKPISDGVAGPPAGHGIPSVVLRALQRGLAPDPAERHPSLGPLLAALDSAVTRRARRVTWVLGTAGVSVLATSMVFAGQGESAPFDPCPLGAPGISGTWDAARKDTLRQRVGKGVSVERTGAQLEAQLDAWAASWRSAQQAACVATRVEGVQSETALDQRNACLERKRRSVDALLDTMLDPQLEIDVAAHAPDLLRELPRLEACSDPTRLAQVQALPPPGAERDALDAAFAAVTRVRTLANVGDFRRAGQQLAELEARAPTLGYLPLSIEVQALPWQLDIRREQEATAIAPLVAVARTAAGSRLDELAASLFVEAAEAAAGRWSKPELERSLVDEARVALQRLGHDDDAREIALRAAGAKLLVEQGALDRALQEHRGALELAVKLADPLAIDRQRNRVASALADLGDFDGASAEYEAVCADAESRWGPMAPLLAVCRFNRGVLEIRRGELEAAAEHLDHAERIYTAAFGEGSHQSAGVRFAGAKLAMFRGELDVALETIDAVLGVYTRELGAGHARLAEVHEARGVLRFYEGDLQGSIESYRSALDIKQRLLAADHPELAQLHANLAESQLALGRPEDALEGFDTSLKIYARTLPQGHPDLALPLKGRGQARLRLGREQEAAKDLERALALVEGTGGEPLELADIGFALAQALGGDGATAQARDRARALATQARARYAELGLQEPQEAIDRWLSSRR